MAKSLTGMVRKASESEAPQAAAPKKSTPKRVEPLTYDNVRSRLTKSELAALAARREAHAVMGKINLVLSTCEPRKENFTFFQAASEAFGSSNVPALEAVYADLCAHTGTTADGMAWDAHDDKTGNFRVYCKFMERYVVWAAGGQSRPRKSKAKA